MVVYRVLAYEGDEGWLDTQLEYRYVRPERPINAREGCTITEVLVQRDLRPGDAIMIPPKPAQSGFFSSGFMASRDDKGAFNETGKDPDDTDPLGIFEIGPFGKIEHEVGAGRLIDTWMDNEGTQQVREFHVPKRTDFSVFSGGKLIYHWSPKKGGDWYGSEKIRRDKEYNEKLRGDSDAPWRGGQPASKKVWDK